MSRAVYFLIRTGKCSLTGAGKCSVISVEAVLVLTPVYIFSIFLLSS